MAIRVARLIGLTAVLVLLLGGLLAPAGVGAQDLIVPLQLSFSDAGARGLGFKGPP